VSSTSKPNWPQEFRAAIKSVSITALMTYLVMPWVTELLQRRPSQSWNC